MERMNMSSTRRVIFTFDNSSYKILQELRFKYGSMAKAVRAGIKLAVTIKRQADQGYTEVICRHPEKLTDRILIIEE